MKIKTGQHVRITPDADALEEYDCESVAGCLGYLEDQEPCAVLHGLFYYPVNIPFRGTWAIREDHFVLHIVEDGPVENEDLRWRRAAQRSWERIHARDD